MKAASNSAAALAAALLCLLGLPGFAGAYQVLIPEQAGRSLSSYAPETGRTLSAHQTHSFIAPSGRRIRVLEVPRKNSARTLSTLNRAGLDYTIDWPMRRLSYRPDDPLVEGPFPVSELDYTVPYHLSLVGAFATWEHWTGAGEVRTAVLDSGFDTAHPDLQGNLWTNEAEAGGQAGSDDDGNGFTDDVHGYNFVDNSAQLDEIDPRTGISHGTAVAGLIGARGDNGEGIAALAGGVSGDSGTQLILASVVGDRGQIPLAAELEAVSYALDQGAKVINMSFGGSNFKELEAEELAAASEDALIIAAAGNYDPDVESPAPVDYPARLDEVIAVGATELRTVIPGTFRETLADYSRYEPGSRVIELTAPGSSMITTAWDGRYHRPGFQEPLNALEGTSFSTPVVSGAAALLWAQTPESPPSEIRERLHGLTDDLGPSGRDSRYGFGRINLSREFETPGDATGDGAVTKEDLDLVEDLFGTERGDPEYDFTADLNGDRVIDELDWLRVARNIPKSELDEDDGNGEGGDGSDEDDSETETDSSLIE